MLEFLQKFNNLPTNIKQKISTPEVLSAIEDLEKRYDVSLANLVIRAMIKDFIFSELSLVLMSEFKLDEVRAATLEAELRTLVFKDVLDYLSPEDNNLAESSEISENNIGSFEVKSGAVLADSGKIKEAVKGDNKESVQVFTSSKNDNPGFSAEESAARQRTDSSHDFLKEDEKDVSGFYEQERSLPPKVIDFDAIAEDIIKFSGMIFASSELSSRLKKIILTYLKGIRTKAEAREGLVKSVLSGGLSLEDREADQILAIAEEKRGNIGFVAREQKLEIPLGKKAAEFIPSGKEKPASTLVEYDLAAELKKGSVKNLSKKELESDLESAAAGAEKEKKEESFLFPEKQKNEIFPKINLEISKRGGKIRSGAILGNKKKMDDVGAPQVMSPIDELSYMDLVVFRRLGSTVLEIIKKIKNKIDLLSKEGIDKQIEGIQAWRRSPVNRTYLSMGQESITEGKSVDDVISARKEKNLNYLTRDEFEAIMDLNNKLRF